MVIGAAVCGTMGTREKPCTPTFRKDCVIGTVTYDCRCCIHQARGEQQSDHEARQAVPNPLLTSG